MMLKSHQELAFKCGPVVEGEKDVHENEAFLQICAPNEASDVTFEKTDVSVDGLNFTVVGGAGTGHLVVLTNH